MKNLLKASILLSGCLFLSIKGALTTDTYFMALMGEAKENKALGEMAVRVFNFATDATKDLFKEDVMKYGDPAKVGAAVDLPSGTDVEKLAKLVTPDNKLAKEDQGKNYGFKALQKAKKAGVDAMKKALDEAGKVIPA